MADTYPFAITFKEEWVLSVMAQSCSRCDRDRSELVF